MPATVHSLDDARTQAAIVNVLRVVDSIPNCSRCRGKVVVQRDGSHKCCWCGFPGDDTRPASERKR